MTKILQNICTSGPSNETLFFFFFLVLLCTRKSVLKICVLGESAHQLHPVPCYTARGFLPPSDLAKEPPLEK